MNPPSKCAYVTDSSGWPTWPPVDPAIQESIRLAYESGQWGTYHSELADELTEALARRHASDHGLPEVRLCSSGTMAVELALRGVGIRPSDEVVVAAYDYPGNLRCIELLGAKPVLVDTESGGVTMCPSSLRQVDGPDIKAVVLSHLYGQLADIHSIRKICDERGWLLVEDACQVPGAGWCSDDQMHPVGTLSHVSTLSFGGSKPLTAGNGGAVITHDAQIASRVRAYVERPSDAFGMSPLQCAALLPQLNSLEAMNAQRLANVQGICQIGLRSNGVRVIQQELDGICSTYYKLAMSVPSVSQRADWQHQLKAIGISTGKGYRSSHRMSERRVRKPVSLTNATVLAEEVVLMDHRFLLAVDLVPRIAKLIKRQVS